MSVMLKVTRVGQIAQGELLVTGDDPVEIAEMVTALLEAAGIDVVQVPTDPRQQAEG